MNSSFPSSRARWRTGHCGESGFALRVPAACQGSVPRRRSAAASAPTKLGIRPSGPGKRVALAARSAAQTSLRSSALAASSSADPPAS